MESSPNSLSDQQWDEAYDNLSKVISEKIMQLPENQRLPILRELNTSDLALMNLYRQALEKEDYETCKVAKVLLLERGIEPK